MPVPKTAPRPEFSALETLNDDWLEKHKNHDLTWSIHTVVKGTKGTKYQECRCFTCRKIARIKIGNVRVQSQPMPPKESRRHSRRRPNSLTITF